ncbi:MAG: FtsX-like permease family protein [Treponema sp.]
MSIKSSFLFASRIVFAKGSKKTVGTKSIVGAVICIALSLIPLVVVVSVSDGMIEGITKRLINLSSSHIFVECNLYDENSIDKAALDELQEQVSKVREVKSSYELINSSGLASSSKGRSGATIRAVDPEIFKTNESYKELFSATDGSIEDFCSSKKRSALIGKEVAEKLDAAPGDTIRLITTHKINGKIIPKMTAFTVSAVISCGYQELDALWVFIPIDEGVKILKPGNSTASIMVETENPFDTGKLALVQQKIEKAVNYEANTYRWDELNKSQYENFVSTKMLLVFIMMLIVLVASVNISSCLVMLSMERRREIAILKSFGTKNSVISLSFIMTGLIIALSGICIGIPLGILISVNINPIIHFFEAIVNLFAQAAYFIANGNLHSFYSIRLMDEAYYLQTIPVHIPWIQIIMYIIAALILSLAASLIPAIKAGQENPIETFRKAGM